MDTEKSSASLRRDSTRSLLATPKNIADAASWLMFDEQQEETFRRCLEGEPLARMLGVVQWLADHEMDPDYRPDVMITGWAKKRGAGCFRPPEPTPAERTWSGNSEAQDREISEAVDSPSPIRCKSVRYEDCADCHARRRRSELWEVQQEHADHHPGLIPGELLCDGCSIRHGIR